MTETNKLVAELREKFGKGAARQLRAAKRTPVVVYGHGTDPVHASVETHPLSLIIRQANSIIELDVNGKSTLVLVKDVQKDAVTQIIEHVDLLIVKKGETVDVEVPLHMVGEPFSGNSALQDLNTIRLSVPATAIPDAVQVSVEGLEGGAQVLAGDVELPKGATLLDPADQLVAHVSAPRGGAAADEEAAE
ncbi:50S ribosomal protein L25/general stress protein Ctc [Leucobacter sp. cx-42]|uniref:50S ribosomal protein L25/general stress protein Ctc n=1 Tax=unclassified Leucobacter TaxID=2621730 RepID=UPI00165E6669|nr:MULTISPECIES: 50S ribosomal protein L25/general stress protein Ctc [unclassified Leucobacter]MBC9953151.1 50S ribosomal protein L25/general stress protein Ctc [Leucobacter sp. cx-42]